MFWFDKDNWTAIGYIYLHITGYSYIQIVIVENSMQDKKKQQFKTKWGPHFI